MTSYTAARQTGIAGFRRLAQVAGGAALEVEPHPRRHADPRTLHGAKRIGERRGIRHGRPGRNRRGIVLGNMHVGNRERQAARRVGRRQPASLDGRQMLADRVEVGDVHPAAGQHIDGGALVVEREPGRGKREHGGSAARQQHEQELVVARGLSGAIERPAGGMDALPVWQADAPPRSTRIRAATNLRRRDR